MCVEDVLRVLCVCVYIYIYIYIYIDIIYARVYSVSATSDCHERCLGVQCHMDRCMPVQVCLFCTIGEDAMHSTQYTDRTHACLQLCIKMLTKS